MHWLGLLFAAALVGSSSSARSQSSDPAALPLIQQENLVYVGAFRLPRSAGALNSFQYGGGSAAYNPAQDSLIVQGRDGFFAEIRIPAIVPSWNYRDLHEGTVLQPFTQIDDQGLSKLNNPSDTFIRGALVHGGRLIASFASYYDANYEQKTSHLSRPLTFATTGQGRGPHKVGSLMPGHVAGHMAHIPLQWQTVFGGSALTGNFGLPIITRESWGPAAHVFDPGQLGSADPLPSTPVLDYPDNDRSLARWNGTNEVWHSDSRFGGIAFPAGYRSVLFIGTHGLGAFCYGDGGATNPNSGDTWCYDPESGDKGTHSYPYVYRIWAYDANDLVAVKRRQKQSWEPRPYGLWNIELPIASSVHKIPSATYDSTNQRLFILQGSGPSDPAEGFPIVHVYRIGQGGRSAMLPPGAPQRLRVN